MDFEDYSSDNLDRHSFLQTPSVLRRSVLLILSYIPKRKLGYVLRYFVVPTTYCKILFKQHSLHLTPNIKTFNKQDFTLNTRQQLFLGEEVRLRGFNGVSLQP